jgi:hypothetical protein
MSAFGVTLFRQYRRPEDPSTVCCQVVTSSEPVTVKLDPEEQRVVLEALYGAILMSQPGLIGRLGGADADHHTLISAAKAFQSAIIAAGPDDGPETDLPGVEYEDGSR